jgi:hypothetical protein
MLIATATPSFKKRKSEKGMAILEAVPALFMVIVIFNFALGFFGGIHSGILNSIGSYNYTMETFRFRSNLMYFRPGSSKDNYQNSMNRVHGVVADGVKTEDTKRARWPATTRPIALNGKLTSIDQQYPADSIDHSYRNKDQQGNVWKAIAGFSPENSDESPVTPEIWIKTIYGICLNAECKR